MGKNTSGTVLNTSVNVSEASITLKSSHDIEIILQRSPQNNTIANLTARIDAIEALGLSWAEIDAKIIEQIDAKIAEIGFDSGYLKKRILTQDEYDALTEYDENVIYVING